MNLSERMLITRNRATGFDYLRIILAISIVVWHSVVTCYGGEAQTAAFSGPYRPLIALILPLFFALSGFLVAGSLARTPDLAKFIALRVLRIFPALVAETLLSAIILGPLLTTAPIIAYFFDYRFRQYLLNMVGDPHYKLLGVFLNNPCPQIINGQLWTVPFELQCYMLLAILSILGVANRRFLIFWCAVALQILLLAYHVFHHHFVIGFSARAVEGPALVMTFLAGVVLYTLRERVPYSLPLFVCCLVATLIGLATPLGDYFIPYPAAYVTIYLGLLIQKLLRYTSLGI